MFSCGSMLVTGRVERRLHPRGWATLALLGAWLVFFGRTVFTTRVPYERDILVTVIPLRHYLLERLRAGEFPQWYPYELLGVPFAGSLVASPFHPQLLLFLLLGPVVGTKWSLLTASFLGLVGAYRLGRELGASRPAAVAGAFVFGFGGYGASLFSNPPFLVPYMTAPWMLAAVHKLIRKCRPRDISWLGVTWALLFLGGDAQLFLTAGFIAIGMLVAFGANRKAWMFAGGTVLLAAALVSVELVPALASEDESIRAFWKPTATLASLWALHPLRLLDFAFPRFVPPVHRIEFGQQFEGQTDLFVSTLFVGGTALALAAVALWKAAPGALLWVAVAVLGLALAMGHRGGLLEVVWSVAPVFSKFRIPEKYAGLAAIAVVPLVAAGVDRVSGRSAGWILAAVGVALLLLGLLVPGRSLVTALAGRNGALNGALGQAMAQSWQSGLLLTGAFVVVLALTAMFASAQIVALVCPLLILIELVVGNAGRTPLASAELVSEAGPLAVALQKEQAPNEPPSRILPARSGTARDISDDDLVRTMHAWFLPDDSGRSHTVAFEENSSAGRARVNRLLGGLSPRERPLWQRRFNVCYRAADARHPARGTETVLASISDPAISLVRGECLPRAYLANAIQAGDADAARDRMRQGMADDDAVWEGGPELTAAGGVVRWVAASPEHLAMDVDATAPAALVVSEAYARGWTATVDGKAAEIHPTNVAIRGVQVPAGHHRVEMKYQAPGLILGAVLSFLGVVCALGLLLVPRIGSSSKVSA